MITAEKLKKIELEERRKAFTESIDKDTNKKKSRLVEISIEKEVIKSEITELQRKQINLESENNEIEEKIKIIESEIETKVKEFLVPIEERWANNQTELKTELTNAENFITINKVVETEELSKFIDKIQGVKEILPVYDTWRQGSEEYATMRERGNILSEIIDNLRKLPSEILKREKLPIKGLSMNEDGEFLIVNSHEIAVSLSQLSGFEKTQLSLDISIARLGEIRVLLIPQWAEVDTKNKERIKKHLEESDIQGIAIEVGIGNFKTIKE